MAYEKAAFDAADAYSLSQILATKAEYLSTALAAGATATSVDGLSQQTWYGVPEAIADDMNQAIDLINLITKKINTTIS